MITALLLGILSSSPAYAAHTAAAYCPSADYPYLETVTVRQTGEARHQCVDDYGRSVPASYSVENDSYSRPARQPYIVVVQQAPPVYRGRDVIVVREPAPPRRSSPGAYVDLGLSVPTRNGGQIDVHVGSPLPTYRARPTRVVHHDHVPTTHVHQVTNGVRCHSSAPRTTSIQHRRPR